MWTLTRQYVETLRHLRPWQVGGRLVTRAKRALRLTQVPMPPPALTPRAAFAVAPVVHDPWNTAEAMRVGQFTFLNDDADLGRPVNWTAASQPLLWRFNLHYFQYLQRLSPREQVALCREWIQANPVGEGVGWHPYPTSLRIVHWCKAITRWHGANVRATDVLQSLYRQAAYLYRNIETYVYGNHLLENARALVLAGCMLRGQGEADAWVRRGLAIYREETPEQILEDGCHFERSPMYHALVLEGYLDVINVLPEAHRARPGMERTARRMTDALATMCSPDGTLALFNDATQEIAPPPEALLEYAHRLLGHEPTAPSALPAAGYYTCRTPDLDLIIDGGAVGPAYLMAHAHADIFSYELCVQGVPFVVDTGVYAYADGPMRSYVRSTKAHNTVTVDGHDQVECWGSFRVARRAQPHDVTYTDHEEAMRFEGSFSGYARRIGDSIRHDRGLTVQRLRRHVTVADRVTGRGRHRVESRIHLHPDVHVTTAEEGFRLERDGVVVRFVARGAPVQMERGWYCPRFGVRQRNDVFVVGGPASLPTELAYRFDY